METRKQLLMTGLFLLIGIVVALLTILMLGGNRRLFQRNAHLYVKFDQVQGLNQGAVVSLSGLPIGNVDGFDFDVQTNQVRVSLRLPEKELNKLVVGTEAEIRTQGALGDKYIYITPGKTGGEFLKDGAELPVTKSADIMAIINQRGNETEKIFDILNDVHILTKTLTADGKVARILANLEKGSDSFSKMSDKATTSMEKFDRVMTKIDKGEGTLGALISDPSIHDQLKSMLGGSQRKSQVKDMLRHTIER